MNNRIELLGAFALCATLSALGLFVLLNNRRAAVNQRFALSAIAIGGWIISISAALSAANLQHTVLLGRLGFAFASTIPFTLLWFFSAFSVDSPPRYGLKYFIAIPGVGCLLFVFSSFSPWIVAGATPGVAKANFTYGPLHRPFGIYFLLCFLFALYTLWATMRRTSGLRRLQLRYLLLGILLGGTGAITTNLLIPLIAKTSRYSALGPYFSLLLVSCSAHAIIRYRLMDIRVVIKKGVVYVAAIAATASIFLIFVEALKHFTGYEKDSIPLAEALLAAVVLAIFFQPLKTTLHRSLNRYVYREPYDYQRTIRDASRRLSTLLDVDPLLAYLAHVVEQTFRAERVTVYLRDQHGTRFIPRSRANVDPSDSTSLDPTLPASSSLVLFLEIERRTLVREEAGRFLTDTVLTKAAQALEVLDGDVAIPMTYDNSLSGFVVVRPKRSGDPYFADDIELLETLVGQAAIAMKNAHLYREVLLIKEYVDNILSTMDSGVIAVDAEGDISLFNPAAERLIGSSSKDLHGKSLEHLPASLASPLRDTLMTNMARSQFELIIPRPEGPVPLVASTATLKTTDASPNGSPHGALIVFSNLTRLKELEREKRRSERLASFGALASGVAHEIKNPLVAIRTFAELLPERFSDEDFRDDFSKVVIKEIARIDDLVGRLRGIAATAPPRASKVDIREPIKDTLALLRGQLEQSHTTVNCHFDDPAPFVAVDDAQLKQLFLNLLLNSIEAMGRDGTITINVSRRDLHGSSRVCAKITDTGPGIPDSVRSHIFDPFFTTKSRGSGLGLSICRGIADAHRGTIAVESGASGRGAAITVEFPAHDDLATAVEQDVIHS